MKTFKDGLNASGFLMPLVKAIELVCGIAFILGRFVPLATIVIFLITFNILSVHVFPAPEGLPVPIFVLLANLFLAYRNKNHYGDLLTIKLYESVPLSYFNKPNYYSSCKKLL